MENDADEPGPDPSARPADQLHDFPIEVRWEATRRHPLYQQFWRAAGRFYSPSPAAADAEKRVGLMAVLILSRIGVNGPPVDPSLGFGEWSEADDPLFLTGSVQPVSTEALAAALISSLPRAELRWVAAAMNVAAEEEYAVDGDDERGTVQRFKAIARLQRATSPAMRSCPAAPIFYVHLGASQRSIVRDIEQQVKAWKEKRGVGSSKVQTAKLEEHLAAFDLREGWAGGRYDTESERSFADVAAELGVNPSTAAKRYRAAFEVVTGHPFSPECWWKLFGPMKAAAIFGDPDNGVPPAGASRLTVSPSRRPVPDSVVSAPGGPPGAGVVESGSAVGGGLAEVDLRMDLETLITRGASDAEIASELGLSPGDVNYYRKRRAEFADWRN